MRKREELRLLEVIHAIQSQYIEDATPNEVFEGLLTALLELTDSAGGFVGEVVETEGGASSLEIRVATSIASKDEAAPWGIASAEFQSLIGRVMTTAAPVMSNESGREVRPADLSQGPPSLDAFLGVPLLHRGRLVGMVGVANRPGGYEERLVEFLAPLLTTCATLLESYRTARERERLRAEMRDNEERTRRIAEVSSDAAFVTDVSSAGAVVSWADAGIERITGYTAEELAAMKWDRIIHDEDRERVLSEAARVPHGETHRTEFRIRRKDGGLRWVHRAERRYPTEREGELQIVGTLHDVTSRVTSELERRRVEEDLRHMQKIDAIGTLAGGVAHDFNNVLYVILGNAELSLKKLSPESPAHKNLSEILAAARRGADVTNRILQYSRVGVEPQGACDVGEVIAETREFLSATLPSTTELVFEGEPNGVFAPVAASDLQQVIVNLCTNASHAMPQGGEVRLTFDPGGDGKRLRLSVRDTGEGMAPSLLQHVFEPYFTTKPRGKGTGLGLSVVQGIVRAAGGAIEVESEVGVGTTLHVWLPRAEPASALEVDREPTRLGRESVLFVDDEPRVVRLAQEILESLGYSVEALTSSRTALERFRADPERFDIVVTDQTMPHLTGDVFAREILRVRPDTPIVLCTGVSENLDGGAWSEIGIHSFLKKPFGLEQLGSTVRRALDERGGEEWQRS